MLANRPTGSGPRALLRAGLFACLNLASGDEVEALEGRVVDRATGKPLANVSLSVVGGTQTARTDVDGKFILVPDPKPPFELLAVMPDGAYVKAVPKEDGGALVVELVPAASESVTVTANAPGIRSAPANGTTTVSREDIRSRASRSLTQTLENVPGVSSVSEGQASVPAIRGMAQARSLVMIDGARVTAERRIGPSATFVDPFILEGVEVARGPGSVAYGSDALGGVVMARTRRPQPGGGFTGGAEATGGIGVPQGRIGLELQTGLGERSGLLFSAHYRKFEDYDSPRGEVLNSSSIDGGFLAGYARTIGEGLFSASIQGDYGRDIGRPRNNSDVTRFYYPEENSLRLVVAYETGPAIGFDSTELSLFLGEYEIITDQDRYATATTPRRILRADVSSYDFGVRAAADKHWGQAQFQFGVDVNGRFGLEAEDVTIDYDASGAPLPESSFQTIEDAQRIDYGVYATVTGAVASWSTLSGGLRYDHVASTNTAGYFGDVWVSNGEPSGYAAVTFGSFGGFSTTLQYAHGFRDARLSDRFFRGVTGAGFITGNPDLEPETSDQYDLALRFARGPWRPAIYVYDYEIDDLIERYEEPAGSELFWFRNRGRARIKGIELEMLADLPLQWQLLVSGSMADGEALDDGSPLDDIAPDNVTVQTRKGFGKRFWVQARASWIGELDEPGPNEVALDAKTVVDLAGGWNVGRGFALSLLVRNVFDEEYVLTADARSPLAPGTSATLTAGLRF